MRRGSGLLIAALALIGVGLVGAIVTAAIISDGARPRAGADRPTIDRPERTDRAGYSSNGERIYYTGVGIDGPIEADWGTAGTGGGMMRRRGGRGFMRMGCVRCHREDGRGGAVGMMGRRVEAADIRYSALTGPHEEDGETEPGWSEQDIARAIREGVEPNGDELDPLMPRWRMDTTDMADTVDYLRELDER